MTIKRTGPYIHVGWLKKLLVGDDSCIRASWFKAHHQEYQKMPSDFVLATWKMKHTALLTALRKDLIEKGHTVRLEKQNQFYLKGSGGITVSGTPDLIGFDKDDTATIYDTKTGNPNQSDVVQVMIYMWALPYSISEFKSRVFQGQVVYTDHRVDVPAESIDQDFRSRLADLIRFVGGEFDQSMLVPSEKECGFCEITQQDCPERVSKQAILASETISDAF